ncbi:MAG: PIN domain-containing protein [Nanoarchaeota archaeon]
MNFTELKDKYFFDSYAIIEVINQSPNYEKIKDIPIITNALCLGEVYFYFLKVHNKQTADFWIDKLKVELTPIIKEATLEASYFKFNHKSKNFSYPDCIGYIMAKKLGIKFLTGDREFKDMENVEFVK